ncbi:MAG: ABC transporter permease [Chloroflexi bacterium]|nr:ABC transporter permease [Chloroflexota bacterium]
MKLLTIAWKDFVIAFRDPGGLVIMLLTPFLLTLVMGWAFGGFDDSASSTAGLADIPVAVVNYDPDGQLGQALADLLTSADLADLLEPTTNLDETAARAAVDANDIAAVVIIPAGLTQAIIPAGADGAATNAAPELGEATIEIYGNPGRPLSVSVIRAIVDEFNNRITAATAAGSLTPMQLVMSGRITMPEAQSFGETAALSAQNAAEPITLRGVETAEGEVEVFDFMGYMAPSMAILFLMFTATASARTILTERQLGTFSRLLTTPTSATEVLGGKLLGTFFIGLAQMLILIVASWLLFQVRWGSWVAVIALIIPLATAATAWGVLIAAYARSVGQANALGTAVSLIFGIGAGNFIARPNLPDWLRTISLISPNAWGLDGFFALSSGGGMADVLQPILGLVTMTAVLFAIATVLYRRQYA